MEEKLNLVPEKLQRLSTMMDESKHEYENLLQLKPTRGMVWVSSVNTPVN